MTSATADYPALRAAILSSYIGKSKQFLSAATINYYADRTRTFNKTTRRTVYFAGEVAMAEAAIGIPEAGDDAAGERSDRAEVPALPATGAKGASSSADFEGTRESV